MREETKVGALRGSGQYLAASKLSKRKPPKSKQQQTIEIV
jgi:hypothetical protein